jgi:ribosomal protein S18 acetylase RimI-like enzyme
MSSLGSTSFDRAARHLGVYLRHLLGGDGVTLDHRYVRLVSGEPHPLGNLAVMESIGDVSAVSEAAAPLQSLAMPSAVILPGVASREVVERLSAMGFLEREKSPAMVLDLDALTRPTRPPDAVFEALDSGAQGEEWVETLAEGYGIPVGVARRFLPTPVPDGAGLPSPVALYGIRMGRRLVACSACALGDGVAGIYCVATIPEARGRGLGRSVTAEPLRRARELGFRQAVLQSSSEGHRMYQQMGFHDLGDLDMFIRFPCP